MIAVLPETSGDCERGFSSLNRIKNAMRSCLQGDHLEALLRISTTKMDAVTLFCDHREALILKWRRLKARRAFPYYCGLISSSGVGFEVQVDAWLHQRLGLHQHAWRSFKKPLRPAWSPSPGSFADQNPRPNRRILQSQVSLMAKRKSPIIKHLHRYNPRIFLHPKSALLPRFSTRWRPCDGSSVERGTGRNLGGTRWNLGGLWCLKKSLIGLLTLRSLFLQAKLKRIWRFSLLRDGYGRWRQGKLWAGTK